MTAKRGTEAYDKWRNSQAYESFCARRRGMVFSEEHRQSLSKARQRRVCTEETMIKMSKSMREVPRPEEWCRNISEGLRGRTIPAEVIAKISKAHLGLKHTDESKMKMKQSFTEERRQYLADLVRGKSPSIETRAKMRIKAMGRHHGLDTLAKLRRPHGHHSPAHIHKVLSAGRQHPNKIEVRMTIILDNLFPGEWRFTGDGSLVINHGNPDFANVNGQKKLIEVYGDYWHRNDDPEKRIAQFREFGWETLVVWEHDVKGDQQVLEQPLKAFCEYH
jgi:G:T-mismatch repair DNA endonuclease (very short patch repair protein)